MQSVIIGPNQAGQRFDKFLHKYLPKAPTSFLYKMLRKKNITLNGRKAQGAEMLKEGDEVKLFFASDTFLKFAGQEDASEKAAGTTALRDKGQCGLRTEYDRAFKKLGHIEVIYEDRHVLILNKPAGILTQKASVGDQSLNEWMIGYLLHKGGITEEELISFKPSVCNRLDRNTSGLVLCGKTLSGSQALSKLIHDRSVRKFYRTIVGGVVEKKSCIEGYLVKNEKTNTVQVFTDKEDMEALGTGRADADKISTAYEPLKRLKGSYTYLEVELITGKTHQIRAHLSGTGHPLLGDYKYGSRQINDVFRQKYGLSGQLLHAYRLEFPRLEGTLAELSGRILCAPLPGMFEKILKDYS